MMRKEWEGLRERSEGRIDPEAGLDACGDEAVYANVLTDFALGAQGKISELRGFLKADDRENFVIRVHALKSTARFLGALDLSEKAAFLEEQGKAMSKQELLEKGEVLLSEYALLGQCVEEAVRRETGSLPLISPHALNNALFAIKELAEEFNFDEIDYIMERLEGYSFPEEFAGAFKQLKCDVTDVARDDIIALVDDLLG